MLSSSVEPTETEISPAMTIPLSSTRSNTSAKVDPWVAVGMMRLGLAERGWDREFMVGEDKGARRAEELTLKD